MDNNRLGPETNLEGYKIGFNFMEFSHRLLKLILKIPNETRNSKLELEEND